MHSEKMSMTVRPATRNDALHVAALIDIAGHGIETEFWLDSIDEDRSAISAARRIIIEDKTLPYHFSKSYLLEIDGEVGGGLIGSLNEQSSGPLASFPPYFAPLLELETFVLGYWAIIGLAVYHEFRGQGHAKRLLDFATTEARAQKAKGLSLVVEDTNAPAVTLYERYGFKTLEKRTWLPFGGRTGPQHWVLMAKPI